MAAADSAPAPDSPSSLQQMLQRLNDLDQRQKMAGAAAIALVLALLMGIWLWGRTPDYAVLFANLEERDGGAIVTALQQQNIPYRHSPNGSAIMIPTDMVHDVRLRMAAEGLPKGGLVGFEVMENQRLGVSQFLEQVNFQRALEGELSRTVQAISSVDSARVHLAIPKQSGFLRDEQHPTASVMVNLYAGRHLEPVQLAGIVHLVASSVPRMANDRVSVIDQHGNLLTHRSDPLRNAALDATQLTYVREVEATYVRRIETILTPILGRDNFKAQITADIDFSQIEETAETFKPNPTPDQAIRSQQTNEQYSGAAGAQGVPGALTNQPPVPATAPIVAPEGEDEEENGGIPVNRNRSATLNYELDRNIQHIRQAPGQIRRLSAAVVVNQRSETLPNGQTRTVALSEEESARINNLVREAMGFNPNRGDSLNVSSAPFAEIPDEEGLAAPIWKDPEMVALGKELLKYVAIFLAVLFIYLALVRPLIKAVSPPPRKVQDDDEAEDDEADDVLIDLASGQKITFEERLARARELAKSDPKAVASLIKEWMSGTEEKKA